MKPQMIQPPLKPQPVMIHMVYNSKMLGTHMPKKVIGFHIYTSASVTTFTLRKTAHIYILILHRSTVQSRFLTASIKKKKKYKSSRSQKDALSTHVPLIFQLLKSQVSQYSPPFEVTSLTTPVTGLTVPSSQA